MGCCRGEYSHKLLVIYVTNMNINEDALVCKFADDTKIEIREE